MLKETILWSLVYEEYVWSNVYGLSEELGFKENRSWMVEQSSEC